MLPTQSFNHLEALDVAFVYDSISCSGSISDAASCGPGSSARPHSTFPRDCFCRQQCSNRHRHPKSSAISSITSLRRSVICLESGPWASGLWGFLRRPVDGESVESWSGGSRREGWRESGRLGGAGGFAHEETSQSTVHVYEFPNSHPLVDLGLHGAPHDDRESPP